MGKQRFDLLFLSHLDRHAFSVPWQVVLAIIAPVLSAPLGQRDMENFQLPFTKEDNYQSFHNDFSVREWLLMPLTFTQKEQYWTFK